MHRNNYPKMHLAALSISVLALCTPIISTTGIRIDRKAVVRGFNPRRNVSSTITPLQVGNGNFAFGVDVTGLQTFSPFATMSTWGWHNFSLPTTPGQTSVEGRLLTLNTHYLTNAFM